MAWNLFAFRAYVTNVKDAQDWGMLDTLEMDVYTITKVIL